MATAKQNYETLLREAGKLYHPSDIAKWKKAAGGNPQKFLDAVARDRDSVQAAALRAFLPKRVPAKASNEVIAELSTVAISRGVAPATAAAAAQAAKGNAAAFVDYLASRGAPRAAVTEMRSRLARPGAAPTPAAASAPAAPTGDVVDLAAAFGHARPRGARTHPAGAAPAGSAAAATPTDAAPAAAEPITADTGGAPGSPQTPSGASVAGAGPSTGLPTDPEELRILRELTDAGFTPDQIREMNLRQTYPQYSLFFDIPELAEKLRTAAAEGWPPDKLRAQIQGTTWWRTTAPSIRAFMEKQGSDPAGLQDQISDTTGTIIDVARRMGLQGFDANAAWELATNKIKYGWTDVQLNTNLTERFRFENAGSPSISMGAQIRASLKKMATKDYLLPISDTTLDDWTNQVLAGKAEVESFRPGLVNQAKSLFPSLSGALDRGDTVATWAGFYSETAARELGINPASIDFTDPKWLRPLTMLDDKGDPVQMSLAEWTKELRSNDIYGWDKTPMARGMGAEFVTGILEDFGAIKR